MLSSGLSNNRKVISIESNDVSDLQLYSGRKRGSISTLLHSVVASAKVSSRTHMQVKRNVVSAMPKTFTTAGSSFRQKSTIADKSIILSSAPVPPKQKLQSAWIKPLVERLPLQKSNNVWPPHARLPPMENYEFYKITVRHVGEGRYIFSETPDRFTIQIASDWKEGLHSRGQGSDQQWVSGYLGSGFSKDAIYVSRTLVLIYVNIKSYVRLNLMVKSMQFCSRNTENPRIRFENYLCASLSYFFNVTR